MQYVFVLYMISQMYSLYTGRECLVHVVCSGTKKGKISMIQIHSYPECKAKPKVSVILLGQSNYL